MLGTRIAYLTRVIRHGKPKNRPNTTRPIVHGTLHAFRRREFWREWRARPRTWPNWAHGRLTTYGGGCRCDKCRSAKAQAMASWRARCRPKKARATPLDRRQASRLAYFRERYQAIKAGTRKVEVLDAV